MWYARGVGAILFSDESRVRAIACLLAVVLVAIPAADVFAFGIHGHTVAVDREGDTDDVAQPGHAGHLVSHHCDLSMTPGEMSPPFDFVAPMAIAVAAAEPHSPHVRSTPFVPSPPPRS